MEPRLDPDYWPMPPVWATITGKAGEILVFIALGAFLLSALGWIFAPKRAALAKVGKLGFTLGAVSLFATIIALAALFVGKQFQFKYVLEHSDATTELQYRIAAVWSGQQGSFLLWSVTSAIFGLLAMRKTGHYRRWFTIPYALFLASLAGILAYESPFVTQLWEGRLVLPPDGQGLQPSLLNYWITIHPPTIFLGFGLLTVLFCWAFAALVERDLTSWVPMIRPWAIATVTLVGIGLCMGGFWAYETLGWGGFWAWDPVENTSFVPWCIGVALIHGLFVQSAKKKWQFGNALLAGAAFLSFVYGTFLTRSGLLADVSVHSFAQMERAALRLLVGIMVVGIVGFLGVWLWRLIPARRLAKLSGVSLNGESPPEKGLSRESMYAATVWLLCGLAVATAFGMSVPMVMALLQRKTKVVDEQLYFQVLVWLFVPTFLAMALAPYIGWRKLGAREVWRRIYWPFVISIGLMGLLMIWIRHPLYGVNPDLAIRVSLPFNLQIPQLPWMGFLVWICLFAGVANLWRMVELWRPARSSLGGLLTHFGVIVTLAGLIVSRGFQKKEQIYVQRSRPGNALGYTLTYQGATGDFYKRGNELLLDVAGRGKRFQARPMLYYVPQPKEQDHTVAWPYIERQPLYDLYITAGALQFEASDPILFKPGESKIFNRTMLLTYETTQRKGEAGMLGTSFTAHFSIKTPEGDSHAHPSIQMTQQGIVKNPDRAGGEYFVALDKIDAKDKTATIQFFFTNPLIPVEMFYKPMTILVWGGAGIMTLGGALAAYNRRTRRDRKPPSASTEEPYSAPTLPDDVLETASKV